jgi:hypothetical protein
MLVIRQAQLAAFRADAGARWRASIVAHLRLHYPDPCAAIGDDAKLDAFVDRCVTKAGRQGIETPGSLTVYLELLVQFGESFERSPVRQFSRNILEHPQLPGDIKVAALRDRHWEETAGRVLVSF